MIMCPSGGTCLLVECCVRVSTVKIELSVLVYKYKVDISSSIVICSHHDIVELEAQHHSLKGWGMTPGA